MVVSARSTASSTTAAPSVEELLAAIQASARANRPVLLIRVQELGSKKNVLSQHGDDIHDALVGVFKANQTSKGLVVIKAVNNLAKNNPQLFSREHLKEWVGKSLVILNDRFSAGDQKSAALTLINDCWDVLETEQKEWVLGQCINTVRLRSCKSSRESILPQLCGAALDLLTNFLPEDHSKRPEDHSKRPEDHSKREDTANRAIAIAILNDGGFNIERVAAAKFVTNYIISSHADALIKSSALEGLVSRLNQPKNYCEAVAAIFHAALGAQAGVGYSQTRIATQPSATNGHGRTWPTRAADSHQPATNPAALARATRPSR
jgi:hypothetical protein